MEGGTDEHGDGLYTCVGRDEPWPGDVPEDVRVAALVLEMRNPNRGLSEHSHGRCQVPRPSSRDILDGHINVIEWLREALSVRASLPAAAGWRPPPALRIASTNCQRSNAHFQVQPAVPCALPPHAPAKNAAQEGSQSCAALPEATWATGRGLSRMLSEERSGRSGQKAHTGHAERRV